MELTIVIPVFNEEANLVPLFDELKAAIATYKTCEIIFVDDGSTDSSFSILKNIQKSNKQVKLIRFRRNFGQTAALAAGFKYAEGDVIVTMDADCQNDPNDIPKLLAKIDAGHDLVSGWRYERKDRFFSRRLPSRIANFLISWTTDVKLHDYGCTLKAMKKEVAKSIMLYGELHRFIPAVASWMGVNIAEVKVNHRSRHLGQSKYGISRTFRVLLDLITVKFLLSYSGRPIHFFGLPGLVCGFIGFFMALYMTIERLFFGVALANRPLLLFAVLLILIGIQFIVFGLLAELQTRTYHETLNKPIFVVKEMHGYN